ncbi:MAG: alpha/beta fold hydrolase [Pseudacidovorax sp.]|uniref:esterase/lipase family protein n=1 Tax=Pseudacidovorax sp. TaxID=1934311 RepID=UPI001B3E5BDF|nr:alpha/beta fold hydrolase [Pseudacidovorax sp.]MBP6897153.1 alpha/beta fold hydrolase [Pseudacidovorax sp.]
MASWPEVPGLARGACDHAPMIARWQRWFVAAWCLTALAWTGFAAARSLSWLIGGWAVLLGGHGVVLAAEFLASNVVNRRGQGPHATLAQLLRAWWAECLLSPRIWAWRQPFRANRIPDHVPPPDGRRGVVLVHGFSCNRGFWLPWLSRLVAQGRCVVAVDLEPPLGGLDGFIDTLDAAVRRVHAATGQAPMLVAHSMGGLVARAWWCRTGGRVPIHRIVTLGTPHAGTWTARVGRAASSHEMRIGSAWLRALDVAQRACPPARFTCWYSNCDNMVFPMHTATLSGADNRPAHGLAHVELAFDTVVMAETLALLDED